VTLTATLSPTETSEMMKTAEATKKHNNDTQLTVVTKQFSCCRLGFKRNASPSFGCWPHRPLGNSCAVSGVSL
jgi:hypothetical protein